MKIILKNIVPILMFFVLLTACSVNEEIDSANSYTPIESSHKSVLSNDVDISTSNTVSLYQGDILYKGIPILKLMGDDISKAIDVLGEPLDVASRPPLTEVAGVYVYDRLYLHIDDNTPIGYITMSPDVCEIDGISLDKNRNELISILGDPKSERFDDTGQYAYDLLLDFEIQGCYVRFCLENSDTKANWIEVFELVESTTTSYFNSETDTLKEDTGITENTTPTPIKPNQSHIGEWYFNKDNLDYLIISEINDDTIVFEMGLIRITIFWATAVIENNKIKFGENISSNYSGPALNGILEFYENSISVIITESEFEYIKAGTIYDFTVKNENYIYPELEALKLVKNYIARGDNSTFEPLNSQIPLSYKFKNSNYMIQYDSKINNQLHLIHQYEFVIDNPETGEGHTATSNWYKVDIVTNEITPMFNEDGSLNENY